MASFGGSVKLEGESEYRNALRDITANLKEVSSELKLANVQFASADKTVKETKTSYDGANSAIREQREKVNQLREALSKAEQVYGSNNEKVRTFKTQLNNAEAQLVSMEQESDKSTKEIKKMKDGFDEAGSGALKFGDILKANILGDVIVEGLKKLGNAVKEVGSAFLNVGKQALASYADYEQLVGGIESMFGGLEKGSEQINKVMDLSKNAWKDLTMSQRDYINSFNSTYPLMKNDIEDQNEAIEKTNRIMTLNSDLANTFGYSMETASNAVNWALKGTFSYLDNLNIGIKGTKEGFLEAAQSVGYTVKSVDELSSSDILDILEKCADKYGVLGKTADEAKNTIQGSTKMMQSAWQNMLTGIADDNADFEGLVNNLVDSITTAAKNIMPRVETIINGIVKLVLSLSEKLIENLPQIMNTGMNIATTLVEGILTMIKESLPQITEAVLGLLPELVTLTFEIIGGLLEALGQALPQIVEQIINIIPKIVEGLINGIPLLINGAIQLLMGIVKAIPTIIQELVAAIPEIITTIINGLVTALPQLIEGAVQLLYGVIEAIPLIIEALIPEIPNIVNTIITGLLNMLPALIDGAFQLFMGIIKAIPLIIEALIPQIPTIVATIVETLLDNLPVIIQGAFQLFLGINKAIPMIIVELIKQVPEIVQSIASSLGEGLSTIKDVGKNLMQGLWNGIKEKWEGLKQKVEDFGSGIVSKFKSVFGIHSPSTLFRDEIGENLALGLGEGFEETMRDVSTDMQNSIPTEFDVSSSITNSNGNNSTYLLRNALLEAFREFNPVVILDDKEVGKFALNYTNKYIGQRI